MKVKVTQKMTDFINKMSRDGLINIDHARMITFNHKQYAWFVGDPVEADRYGDYDIRKGVFKVIVIIYPDKYHACNKYLTTKEMNYNASRLHIKTENELRDMLKDMIQI